MKLSPTLTYEQIETLLSEPSFVSIKFSDQKSRVVVVTAAFSAISMNMSHAVLRFLFSKQKTQNNNDNITYAGKKFTAATESHLNKSPDKT